MSLGARLKELRVKKNQSLQEVADAVGASKAHIWEIERGGSKNPSMDLLNRIADHFGVSVTFLVGEEPPGELTEELIALYRDLKDLSESDRETIRNLTKRLKESKGSG
jgi:transcriptional regulator with XRE-family HTH domain